MPLEVDVTELVDGADPAEYAVGSVGVREERHQVVWEALAAGQPQPGEGELTPFRAMERDGEAGGQARPYAGREADCQSERRVGEEAAAQAVGEKVD